MSFSIRPLSKSDLKALRALFLRFPHKAQQQRAQNLDPQMLADRFVKSLEAGAEKATDETGPWVGTVYDEVDALAGLQDDAWHSRFYPYRFGRIAPLNCMELDGADRHALIGFLLEQAMQRGYEHLITRVDGSEFGPLESLTEQKFYLVDCSLKMSAPISHVPDLAPPSKARGAHIRKMEDRDLEAIRRIAATSHPMNHYYNDPWLDKADTDALFAAWVERCCRELPSEVFVLERRDEVQGFAIYLKPLSLNRDLREPIIILDFVCLDEKARGGGIGRWFIGKALRILADEYEHVELRTSQNNYAAQSCYADLGIKTVSTDFVLHRHLGQ
ncbi:MAG: N-acetyltransferase family protein [Candidatus Sumerlaeia bacterium]